MRTLILGILAMALNSVMAAEPARDLIGRPSADGEFAGWKSFHEDASSTTSDVWQLREDGVLVCKGTPRGYLYTEQDYTDVSLEFEWRWPPDGKPGNGGLLLRTTGEHKIWPKSLEVQLNNGQAGDFWGLVGYELSGPAERVNTGYAPGLRQTDQHQTYEGDGKAGRPMESLRSRAGRGKNQRDHQRRAGQRGHRLRHRTWQDRVDGRRCRNPLS